MSKKKAKDTENRGRAEASASDEPEVDVGSMVKGLGGLFGGLVTLIEKASALAEKGEELKKSGEFRVTGLPGQAGKDAKGVYGFTIRTLADGKRKVQTFGNIKKTPAGPVVEEVREPIVDVFDEGDSMKIIAELPGISTSDVKTEVNGDILTVSAAGKGRKYTKEIHLPVQVDEGKVSTSYENGVLEITLVKKAATGK